MPGEAGGCKPDARPCAPTLIVMRVDHVRAVVAGDSLDRDLIGARNAGIRGIWIERTATVVVDDSRVPEAGISDVHQLPTVL